MTSRKKKKKKVRYRKKSVKLSNGMSLSAEMRPLKKGEVEKTLLRMLSFNPFV